MIIDIQLIFQFTVSQNYIEKLIKLYFKVIAISFFQFITLQKDQSQTIDMRNIN